jgi:DUF4097 and DUF4098 domain-containing protein YvlB
MKIRLLLALLTLVPSAAFAWGDGCELRADRAAGTDAKGVEKVLIRIGAGDAKVIGRSSAVRIEARGTACASKQEYLDAAQIVIRREGNIVYVETELPQNNDGSWKLMGNNYAYIDIGIALPANIPVEAQDSSGDLVLEDLASLVLTDSSGDLEINRIAGAVDVTDSSGDIDIDYAGSARVRDSSGDVGIEHTKGMVNVVNDSSGDIEIVDVQNDVLIESDSSGGIRVEEVRGSVTVDSDSSGDIYAARVGGDFTVKSDTSGSIGHDSIGGKVSVPSNKRDDVDVE